MVLVACVETQRSEFCEIVLVIPYGLTTSHIPLQIQSGFKQLDRSYAAPC